MRLSIAFITFMMAVPAAADPPYRGNPDYVDPADTWRDRARDDRWERRGRYDRWERDRWERRDPYLHWQQLTTYASAREGTTYLRLPPRAQFSRVRVEGTHGAPVVTMVEVFYVRDVQRTRVDRRLRRGEGVDVPVDPRRLVRGIAIHTDPRYRGGYSVWGG